MNTQSQRVALITGGSRGLGRNTAESLARKGVDAVITYHSRADEARTVVAAIEAQGRKAVALQLDSAAVGTFDRFAETLKSTLQDTWSRDRFDYLINNAGISHHNAFEKVTEAEVDDLYNTNFKGVFFLTQKLLPFITDGGRIVNVSTGLTRFVTPDTIPYASLKGAVEVFTRYLAKELGPRGITVNAVAPGAIATDFSGGVVRDNPAVNKLVAGMTALGRVGVPDDIGPVIASLVSDDNHWVTGQRIEASGGMVL
ncbi:MAG TPA: SDR family oxidoreductase [Vicinamibacterales bacterium]|nr:SDR family oxidoreductase [Vicinamibacterales bacterium]